MTAKQLVLYGLTFHCLYDRYGLEGLEADEFDRWYYKNKFASYGMTPCALVETYGLRALANELNRIDEGASYT